MPRTSRPVALSEVAAFLGVDVDRDVEGDPSFEVHGFASLGSAKGDELVFVRDDKAAAALGASDAGAVIAPAGVTLGGAGRGLPIIRSPRPALDFSRALEAFAPRWRPEAGIDPTASIDSTARVDPTASIGPGAHVGPQCRVGARTVIGAHVTLVARVEVGADGWIHPQSVLREDTRVGDRVVLQPGVVLGGDGFGYVADPAGRPVAMAQRGRVVLEDDVEIGAHTTVDRATLDETRIRRGAKIDNQVQIAHNCDIGEDVIIAALCGLSGGTVIGDRAILMGRCVTAGHLRIGAGAFLGGGTGVTGDVPDGARVFGTPATEERSWHRSVSALRRLPELLKRVRRLERAAGESGQKGGSGTKGESGEPGESGEQGEDVEPEV